MVVTRSEPEAIDLHAHVPGCFATDVEAAGATYTRLEGEGFGHGVEMGRADLPVVRRHVEVPFGAQVAVELVDARFVELDMEDLGLSGSIYPLQPPTPKTPRADQEPPFEIDEAFYRMDALYPADPLVITDEYIVRGHRIVVVEVWPVAYRPAEGRLRLYSDVELRLRLTHSDLATTEAQARRYASPVFDTWLSDHVLNYNQGQPGLSSTNDLSLGYLIITDDAFYNAMLPFVTLKSAQGFDVTMTRTSDISGGATTSAIKAYIQDAYDTWPTPPSYVLLVGDTNTVPGWNSVSAAEVTDLYYATMDGTSDWVPDIGRGRFPVRTVDQATIMVDKVLNYASLGNADWLEKIAFIATCDRYWVAEGTHDYAINNYTIPEGYTGTFPNDPQAGGDQLYCITHSAGESDIQSALNDGRWAVIYSGHGGWTGWEMGFGTDNVQSLTSVGVLPFVASHACITGDFAQTEVFGETWVRQDDKGALVFWGSSDSSYWDEDDVLERSVFDALFDDGPQPSVAGMTDFGLAAVQTSYPSSARYYWETYNILGDPSIQLLLDAPDFTLAASPAERIVSPTGAATYTVELEPLLGYSETVTLTVDGLPVDTLAAFEPSTGTPPFTATLNVTTTATTPIGSYPLTITGADAMSRVHGDQVLLTVRPWPDLTITKSAPATSVEVGMPLQYTLVVANDGGPATGGMVSDTVPSDTTFAWADGGGEQQGNAVVWSGLTLPASSTVTLTYGVAVNCVPSGTEIVNDAYQVHAHEWPTPTVGSPVTVTAVSEGLSAGFTFPTPVLVDAPVPFTNLSQNGYAYDWSFGDGGASTAEEPTHAYRSPGERTVVLTATNLCHGSAVASDTLTVEDYAVAVDPADAGAGGDPGAVVTYTLRVTNTGTLSDDLAVSLWGNGWPSEAAPGTVTLDPGVGAEVVISVTMPADAEVGDEDAVTVRVQSTRDPRSPAATGLAELTTTANAVYGVTLSAPVAEQEGLAGDVLTYTLTVVNTSNVVDEIHFWRENGGWPTAFSVDSRVIAAQGVRTVEVYVTIPPTATGGEVDVATIRAVGSGDYGEVPLTSRYAQWHAFLPAVLKDTY